MNERRTILDMFGVTPEYLTAVVLANPSLRGIIIGYIAERKLRDWFISDGRVTAIKKDDDHDRASKGDLVLTYQDFDFRIEVKSLQTNSIEMFDTEAGKWLKKVVQEAVTRKREGGRRQRRKWIESEEYKVLWRKGLEDARYRGAVQCDASDRRTIVVGGQEVVTTNLRVGEFDILAVGLFAFREKWDFGFILNRDLPRSTYKKYPEEVRNQLIKTMIPVAWPLPEHVVSDPFVLLDKLVEERQRGQSQKRPRPGGEQPTGKLPKTP